MVFFTILVLSILTGAELDLFIPSFPELQQQFNLSTFKLEALLSINLITHCIGTFIAGWLGDVYGRKSTIIGGLILFIIGSLMCLIASNYYNLLLGRAFQGIGIAAPVVLSFLVIVDQYNLNQQQSMMGLLNGFSTIAMSFAPVIGSYISLVFKWHGNFMFLLFFGIICLILVILLIPSQASTPKEPFKFDLNLYVEIITNHKIIYYIIMICLLSQSYWIFIGMSPILYMHSLKVSLKEFGFYQGALCISFAISSLLSSYLLNNFGAKKCFYFGIMVLIIFTMATSILLICNNQDPLLITLALQLEGIGVVFPINILWPLALNLLPNSKAKVASIMVGGRLIITSISLQVVSYYYRDRFFEIGVAMLISLLLALVFLIKFANKNFAPERI